MKQMRHSDFITDSINYCFSKQGETMSNVNHPPHYNTGKIEVIEFIEDKRLGFHLGNAVKYIARAGRKDPSKKIEDLQKAAWYLARKIELLQARKQKRTVTRPNDMNERS